MPGRAYLQERKTIAAYFAGAGLVCFSYFCQYIFLLCLFCALFNCSRSFLVATGVLTADHSSFQDAKMKMGV